MQTFWLILGGYLLAGLWNALDVHISLIFSDKKGANMTKFFIKNIIFWPLSIKIRLQAIKDHQFLLMFYGLLALFFLSVSFIAWIKGPEGFAAVSGCIIFTVFGIASSYLSYHHYRASL